MRSGIYMDLNQITGQIMSKLDYGNKTSTFPKWLLRKSTF